MNRFKVIEASTSEKLEEKLNEWASSLSEQTKIRRTQLAVTSGRTVALINYETTDDKKD